MQLSHILQHKGSQVLPLTSLFLNNGHSLGHTPCCLESACVARCPVLQCTAVKDKQGAFKQRNKTWAEIQATGCDKSRYNRLLIAVVSDCILIVDAIVRADPACPCLTIS